MVTIKKKSAALLGLQALLIFFSGFAFSQNQELQYIPVLTMEKTKRVVVDGASYTRVTGYIDIPEDRGKVNSRTIRLPVTIFKSINPEPSEPVFRLAGGPGESNMVKKISNPDLLKHHDFVFVGYRGVDGSTSLKSMELTKALKGLNNELLSDASLNNIENAAKAYLTELENKGIDITQYNIPEVIEDMEYTRKALGYDKINLLSSSYGTRVALIYSYKYPDVIHRTVMNGANPPGHFLWYPDKTQEILGKWEDIYVSNNQGSIKEAMQKAFEHIPEKWSIFTLDKDKIKTGTFVFLFSAEMAVMAFDSYFRAANHNDYSGLYLIQKAYDLFVPGNVWGDMFQKGFSSDFDPNIDYRHFLRSFDDRTLLGANYALLLWGSAGTWQGNPIPEEYRKLRPCDTRTLILSGELDVSTPVDYTTEKLLPSLSNAQHIILGNMSHTDVSGLQPGNYRKIINTFFLTGSADPTIYETQSINFKPKYKLHKLAKWALPITIVFLTILILIVIKTVRFIVRKCNL